MSRNNDYTTGKLLDYLYRQKYCKLIGIDLSRQTNMCTGKLEENDCTTLFFIPEKQQKTIPNFF